MHKVRKKESNGWRYKKELFRHVHILQPKRKSRKEQKERRKMRILEKGKRGHERK